MWTLRRICGVPMSSPDQGFAGGLATLADSDVQEHMKQIRELARSTPDLYSVTSVHHP